VYSPDRIAYPSQTGTTLAKSLPISTIKAVPFPAANLVPRRSINQSLACLSSLSPTCISILASIDSRAQNTRTSDIKPRNPFSLESYLGHQFPRSRGIPCGLGEEERVLSWIHLERGVKGVMEEVRESLRVGYWKRDRKGSIRIRLGWILERSDRELTDPVPHHAPNLHPFPPKIHTLITHKEPPFHMFLLARHARGRNRPHPLIPRRVGRLSSI
jgi:hypothetical protein